VQDRTGSADNGNGNLKLKVITDAKEQLFVGEGVVVKFTKEEGGVTSIGEGSVIPVLN